MKLFVPLPRADRAPKSVSTGSPDSLGHGMDIALMILVFVIVGIALDRWLGTAPLFTIALIVLGSIGQFVKMKYSYDAQMERLEAERRARMASGGSSSSVNKASVNKASVTQASAPTGSTVGMEGAA